MLLQAISPRYRDIGVTTRTWPETHRNTIGKEKVRRGGRALFCRYRANCAFIKCVFYCSDGVNDPSCGLRVGVVDIEHMFFDFLQCAVLWYIYVKHPPQRRTSIRLSVWREAALLATFALQRSSQFLRTTSPSGQACWVKGVTRTRLLQRRRRTTNDQSGLQRGSYLSLWNIHSSAAMFCYSSRICWTSWTFPKILSVLRHLRIDVLPEIHNPGCFRS